MVNFSCFNHWDLWNIVLRLHTILVPYLNQPFIQGTLFSLLEIVLSTKAWVLEWSLLLELIVSSFSIVSFFFQDKNTSWIHTYCSNSKSWLHSFYLTISILHMYLLSHTLNIPVLSHTEDNRIRESHYSLLSHFTHARVSE